MASEVSRLMSTEFVFLVNFVRAILRRGIQTKETLGTYWNIGGYASTASKNELWSYMVAYRSLGSC